ncbi:MAG: fluoride efflux transporter CrcB [Planctomycetaceae bacterium]|nr:fluoride efflux transporter CrcB [Planctomycetaceae bacterium]
MTNLHNIAAIAVGGGIGALCRHGVNVACRQWLGEAFAYGTLTVNVLGCFAMGLLATLAASPHWAERAPWIAHSAVTVGFLGALTTFSTFGIETVRFSQASQHHLAVANVAANLLLGVLAVLGGMWLGRQIVG